MRRSKSDPAKYARNYRKISQRRMTQYDGVDEEKEMERLRAVLRDSERQLKQAEEPEEEVAAASSSKKRKRKKGNAGATEEEEASSNNTASILSEELTSELSKGYNDEENPLVVIPSKRKRKKDKKTNNVQLSPEEIREAKVMQKKTAKKLQQLEARAAQKKKRAELYKRLEESQTVPRPTLQPLLLSSGKLSRKDSATKKQALKKILNKERAGMSLTKEERELLYPEQIVDEEQDLMVTDDSHSKQADIKMEASTKATKSSKKKKQNVSKQQSVEKNEKQASLTEDRKLDSRPEEIGDLEGDQAHDTKASGPDFAALMMASLTKLNTDTKNAATSASPENDNELTALSELSKRYVPRNPTVVKTAASLGLKPSPHADKNSKVLEIKRPEDVAKSRFDLPVTAMEFEIVDAIRNNDVTIICGETGSGKSTQVPTYLYENGMTACPSNPTKSFLIGITQPRRVAAVSTAKRVCYEMGQGNGQSIRGKGTRGNLVAYQTRYESAGVGDATNIKFMTDGILLNEIQSDLLLRRYSIIVLDESHERNLNTDVLIGLLSAALPLRKKAAEEDPSIVPLKLVLMSATLRVEDFTKNDRLFPTGPPAVVRVPGRTYPVTIHHSKVTELDDYESAAYKKICKIHRKLPHGGILVFLTGKDEIVRMIRRLRASLNGRGQTKEAVSNHFQDVDMTKNDHAIGDLPREMDDEEYDADDIRVDDFDEIDNDFEDDYVIPVSGDDNVPAQAKILPLYSLLSAEEQAKVFAPVPENCRLIVISTNIAETSITIPGISYVVDAGRQKCRNYNSGTGVASYDIMWISRAAADQRAGRAGRTSAGQCYRLYSSSLYSRHMDQFALPEVLSRPLEDVVLAMKAMKISNVSTFPFPTAVKILGDIGCLDTSNVEIDGGDGTITRLGYAVSKLPLGVRYAKMLLVAANAGILDYAIVAVAALSEADPFSNNVTSEPSLESQESKTSVLDLGDIDKRLVEEQETRAKWKKRWYHSAGDVFAVVLAVGAFTYSGKGAGGASEIAANRKFCEENGLNYTVMNRIQKMRAHLASLAKKRLGNAEGVAASTGGFLYKMAPPNEMQERLLKQCITSGLLDHVALLATPGSISGDFPIDLRSAYVGCRSSPKDPLFLDRGGSVYNRDYRQLPRWVCFDSVIRKVTKDGTCISVMKNVTPIEPQWISEISNDTRLVSYGAPVALPQPSYDPSQDAVLCSVTTKYGNHGWKMPPIRKTMFDTLQSPEARGAPVFRPDDSFRWFARYLWEGKVIVELASLLELMNDSPALITRKSPSSKVTLLVESLSGAGVDSAAALRKHWAEIDDKFLFKHVKRWVKSENHAVAKKTWISAVRQNVKRWKDDQAV
ncbi:MAG: hypothetical protein SGILL_001977 [Bacillariaceae sp.]